MAWSRGRRHPPTGGHELGARYQPRPAAGELGLQWPRALRRHNGPGARLGGPAAGPARPRPAPLGQDLVPRSAERARRPGPVLVTSTKPDVLQATMASRSQLGRCWLLDPSGTLQPPPGASVLRWSPVAAAHSWEEALVTARVMTAAARPHGSYGDSAHWTERAEALLAPLLHAAALANTGMRQVLSWALRHDAHTPMALLGAKGGSEATLAADVLAGHRQPKSGRGAGYSRPPLGPWPPTVRRGRSTWRTSPTSTPPGSPREPTPSMSAAPPGIRRSWLRWSSPSWNR